VSILTELGEVASRRGDYGQADVYLIRAKVLAERLGRNPMRLSAIYTNMGIVATKQGRFGSAKKHLQQAVREARSAEDPWRVANALNALGEFYLHERDLVSAGQAFEESADIARENHTKEPEAAALYGLARLAAAETQLERALALASRSLEIYRSIVYESRHHFMAEEIGRWLDTLLEQRETTFKRRT
jgi:tetratricopeptide (TPR) repeat protein